MIADLKGLNKNFFINSMTFVLFFVKIWYFCKRNYDISKVLRYWAMICIDFITE